MGTSKNFPAIKLAYLFIAVLLLHSCNNLPDPSIERLVDYSFYSNNVNSVSVGGEYLNDSIYVQVQNRLSPLDVHGFNVEFQILSGGGSVDQDQVGTKKNGKASTRWKLGTNSFSQTASAKIYGPDGKFFSEIRYSAYGMLYNAWNEVTFYPFDNTNDVVADTIRHLSWMIAGSKIYKRGANFLDWQVQNISNLKSIPREIEIDSNGTIYLGTWSGTLFKSTNQGTTWQQCADPIPNRPYYFYFWITNDGDLWATVYERGLWHSKDGGTTWTNPANGMDTNTMINGAFRLKNGWLLSLSETAPRSVIKSEDDGKTWTLIESPAYPTGLYVTEKEEIIVNNDYGADNIYKSTDLGKTFKLMHTVSTTFGTSGLYQTYFHKYGSYYYELIPGHGVLKTQNFEQFETILNEPNVGGLYIDHTGTLIVRGWHEKLNRTFFYARK